MGNSPGPAFHPVPSEKRVIVVSVLGPVRSLWKQCLVLPQQCGPFHTFFSFQLLVLSQAEKVLEEVDWLIAKIKGSANQETLSDEVTPGGDCKASKATKAIKMSVRTIV